MSAPATDGAARTGNLFLRIIWLFLGPMAIPLVGLRIANQPPWVVSILDAVFWLGVALVIGARVLDAGRFSGLTADGSPTTRAHLFRHGLGLILVSGIVWVVGQSVEL